MHPVDEPPGDGDHADVAARLHASLSGPSLDPATRQRHLQAVRARAATLPAPAAIPAAGGLGRRLASAATAAGLVVVMGASGAVAASHDALPGQLLYPVKQATEQLVLAAPTPAAYEIERHVSFADRRLDEAAALTARDADPALVAETIAAHTRLLARAGELAGEDAELAGRVDAATAVAHRRLSRLLDQGLPEVAASQARAALSAAEDRLDRRPAPPASTPPPPAPTPPPLAPQAPSPAPPRGPAGPEQRPSPPAQPVPPPAPDRTPAPAPRPAPAPPDPGPPEQRPGPEAPQPGSSTSTPNPPDSASPRGALGGAPKGGPAF